LVFGAAAATYTHDVHFGLWGTLFHLNAKGKSTPKAKQKTKRGNQKIYTFGMPIHQIKK